MSTDPRVLRDDAARRRIRRATDTTLLVNAGAGCGETSALVDRIVTLVMDDGVPLRHVAAVTFTEKAGAELRDRLRGVFETRVREHDTGTPEHETATAALEDLDRAAIGTLHSFAQRILREHAIAATLPPLVEVQDEVASSVAFDERWAAVQVQLLDDDEMERPLLLALSAGVTLEHLRALMRRLGNDWDLLEDRVLAQPERPITVPDLGPLRRQMTELLDLRTHCRDENDKLLACFGPADEALAALADVTDEIAALALLRQISGLKFSFGRTPSWDVPVDDVKAAGRAVAEAAGALAGEIVDRALRALTRWLAARVLESAQERRREGRLEFQDLLVLSRDLLRRDGDARAALQRKYRRLLLDEFQDTDPLQIEIAVRIAGGAAAAQPDWRDVEVPAGSLFVVGDAKQSIYKFRRADIATYLQTQEVIGERVSLTTNFRTVAPVLDW